MAFYRVHAGSESPAVVLRIREADGSWGVIPFDADTAALLARLGDGDPSMDAVRSVDVGELECAKSVRFFRDGKRIGADAALSAIAGGVRRALKELATGSGR